MCPDRELISAWYDGETDGRWMSEIKRHVDECNDCAAELDRFRRLSSSVQSVAVPGEQQIKERLYASIERKKHVVYPEPFWQKHFEISFPMLVGAAAVVFMLFTALLVGILRFGSAPEVVEEIKAEPEVAMQVISLEEAAAFILSDDSGFDVLITIPSSDALSLSGEPQLIREADYKRGQ